MKLGVCTSLGHVLDLKNEKEKSYITGLHFFYSLNYLTPHNKKRKKRLSRDMEIKATELLVRHHEDFFFERS